MYVPVPGPVRGGRRCGRGNLIFLVGMVLVAIGVLACMLLYK